MKKRKLIIIILAIIIFISIALILRKYLILNQIKNKAYEILSEENLYLKTSDTYSYQILRKSNTQRSTETQNDIIIEFAPNDIYLISVEKQMYRKTDNPVVLDYLVENIRTTCFLNQDFSTIFNQLKLCFKLKISSETFLNKDCYVFSIEKELDNIYSIYVDKEALLVIATTYAPKNEIDTNPIFYEWNFEPHEHFDKEKILKEYTNAIPNS